MAQTLHYSSHHTLNISIDNNHPNNHRHDQNAFASSAGIASASSGNASSAAVFELGRQGHLVQGQPQSLGQGQPLKPLTPPRSSKIRHQQANLGENAVGKSLVVGILDDDSSEHRWTSFNTHDSETEDTPESRRRFSESEHQNLLADDYDQLSEDEDPTTEESSDTFLIGPVLRQYYVDQFLKLEKLGNRGRCGAIRGSDPHVQEFFFKSKLDQSQLSKIWSLSDINKDGYLNLNEFIVAMHLIVRTVKGKYEIPDQLPAEFQPPLTPPRTDDSFGPTSPNWPRSTSIDQSQPPRSQSQLTQQQQQLAAHWTTTQTEEVSSAAAVASDWTSSAELVQPNEALAPPPTNFTSRPPIQSKMVHPKPRRISPDVSNVRAASQPVFFIPSAGRQTAAIPQQQQQGAPGPGDPASVLVKSPPPPGGHVTGPGKNLVLSPQALNPPKGPPPKPPPRPPLQQRHTRSISLDLNKSRFSPPLVSEMVSNGGEMTSSTAVTSSLAGMTSSSAARTSSSAAVTSSTAIRTHQGAGGKIDKGGYPNNTSNVEVQTDPLNDPMTSSLILTSTSAASTAADRCALLKQTNDELERELKRLVEIRLALQNELKRFNKN